MSSENILVAVVTCGMRKRYADAQRKTWAQHAWFGDVRFFLAKQTREPEADEVFLEVDDEYGSLPKKVQAVHRWACDNGYDWVLKLDDDVLLFPTRVIRPKGGYAGWIQEPQGGFVYCAGMAYWLARREMEIMADAPIAETVTGEDLWTGIILQAHGVKPESILPHLQWFGKEKSRKNGLPPNWRARLANAYVAGEFGPDELVQAYVY